MSRPLRAAILARRSTAQQEDSLDRQLTEAARFIDAKGWTHDPQHTFFMDHVSGALGLALRSDLQALIAAAQAGKFDVLVLRIQERASRDFFDQMTFFKAIFDAGVQVHQYSDGREIKAGNAIEVFMLATNAFVGQAERERIRDRCRETAFNKARSGLVAGGKRYGHRNVRTGPKSVVQEVHPDEAPVVLRIFTDYAAGSGLRAIARSLNEDGIPSPRGRPWQSSAVRAILTNPAYAGRFSFGKRRKAIVAGRKVTVPVPEELWESIDFPHLRIVPQELWEATAARFARNKRRGGSGPSPRGILTGNLRCSACGGRVYVVKGHDAVTRHYGCGTYNNGGRVACANGTRRPQRRLDEQVARQVQQALLGEDLVEQVVARAAALGLEQSAEQQAELRSAERRLQEAQKRRDNFVAAIGGAEDPSAIPGLSAACAEAERKLTQVRAHLTRLHQQRTENSQKGRELAERYRAQLEDLPALLLEDVARGREALSALLAEPLAAVPIEVDGEARWLFQGRLRPAGLLAGGGNGGLIQRMVTPTGFEPVLPG